MTIQQIHNQDVWNELLLSQPTQAGLPAQAGIFLQSWEWGEFQKAVGRPVQISAPAPTRPDELQSGKSQKFQSGRRVYRYRTADGSAQAQVIELTLPMGKKYWFIPRGTLIPGLEKEARKHGALFVRYEPLEGDARLDAVKTKSINPSQTLIMDLGKSEEELLAAMHEKTRYNIRLAARKGVRCQVIGISEFEQFWRLMQETARRDRFRTHERGYYETMLRVLSNPSRPSPSPRPPSPLGRGEGEGQSRGVMSVRLHMAYHSATPLAAAIVAYFGDTVTYLHGASSYEHRALMGPYALHWEIMRDAKALGYKFYDFWGIQSPSPLMGEGRDEGARGSWAGITRFKMGFGGTVVDYPGTFDLPLSRMWYTLYRFGRIVFS